MDVPSINNSSIETITNFIVNHTNTINYDSYDHIQYIDIYKQLFVDNNINYKLYNFDKYISIIKHLDINSKLYST